MNGVMSIDILRRRMHASVLLIKALGGGWNASQLPKTAAFAKHMVGLALKIKRLEQSTVE